jgi:inner membrane protein
MPDPGGPARIAGMIILVYIGFNLAESFYVERATANALRGRGIEPVLVVAGPPPLAFWERTIQWRSADRFGSGSFDPRSGIKLDRESEPLGLNDPQLALAKCTERYVRSFLVWSRMPIVVKIDGRTYLSDQRFYGAIRSNAVPGSVRRFFRGHAFLVPLDNR